MTLRSRLILAPVLTAIAAAAPLAVGALAAPAAAAPECADYTVIGVSGSGESNEAGGLGTTVAAAAQAFSERAEAAGKSVTVRTVRYPATPVPTSADQLGGFIASMNTGAANTQGDVEIVAKQCPQTKIALVGYSQGAAGVHRALQRLGDRPQIVAAGLIADPDRLVSDTVVRSGTAPASQGMAQAVSAVTGANPAPLPARLGARTVSVCSAGDPVCQWTGDLSGVDSGVHTSYRGAEIGARVADLATL